MATEDSSSTDNKQNNGKSAKKNFFIISISFILVYTSYNAVTNLQSSINTDENVGLNSLAIISGCSVLACIFFTNPIIFLAGYKWTIFIAQFGIALFVAANIYPKPWLMYPASVVSGFFEAGLWTAQSAYIADLSKSKEIGNEGATATRYFGIFFFAYQTNAIWGELITYLVLRNNHAFVNKNVNICGANYLESEQHASSNDSNEISVKTASILYGIFVGLIVISLFLVAIFLDQKQHLRKAESKAHITESFKHLMSTLKQMKNPKQIFLLPLPFWIGVSEAFTWTTFTNAFITCSVGIQYIGLIMLVYGVVSSVFSIIVGYLGKFQSCPLFVIASIVSYGLLIAMLLWKPHPSQTYVLYILSGLQGLTSAIWDPIESGLYEIVFPNKEEAAFSNMWLGQNAGHLVVYLYAEPLRVRTSICIQIGCLTIALIGYFILEIEHVCKQRKTSPVTLMKVTAIEVK